MEKFKIEMTKDEMIRYYANKIVEDGIKECSNFDTTIDISNYENANKYRNEILQRIYRDERVADINLDRDGIVDMVFYTDYCPFYYDEDEMIEENKYNYDPKLKRELLEDFSYFYTENCLFNNPYISMRELLNQFANKQSLISEDRDAIKNIIKKILIESDFVQNNLDGVEVYVTPKNYKKLEKVIEDCIQNTEEEELE